MKSTQIFDDGQHQWIMLARDPDKASSIIDSNEYLIVSGGEALMLDPGGTEVFPAVLGAASDRVEISRITRFFLSHQDPDVITSLPLWLGLCPRAKVYLPSIWSGFIAHLGIEYVDNFVLVPDEGLSFDLGSSHRRVDLVPAHYCHSSSNFSLYDPHARILFSGDIGAALLPAGYESPYVDDFEQHIQYMNAFHVRWMPSSHALRTWVQRVRQLDVQMIAPQHGAIFRGEQVGQFLTWLEHLEVAAAVPS